MSVWHIFVPLQSGNKTIRVYIMAGQIKYIAPVDSVSGMFGKRENSFSGKAIISNVRMAPSQKHPKGHMYFSVLTRTTFKESELGNMWRDTFTQICRQTRERLRDPNQIATDQAGFVNQTKYKTLYAYVWNKVKAIVIG